MALRVGSLWNIVLHVVWQALAWLLVVLIKKPQNAPCPVDLLLYCSFAAASWFIFCPAGFPPDLDPHLSWKVVSSLKFCWNYTFPLTAQEQYTWLKVQCTLRRPSDVFFFLKAMTFFQFFFCPNCIFLNCIFPKCIFYTVFFQAVLFLTVFFKCIRLTHILSFVSWFISQTILGKGAEKFRSDL